MDDDTEMITDQQLDSYLTKKTKFWLWKTSFNIFLTGGIPGSDKKGV